MSGLRDQPAVRHAHRWAAVLLGIVVVPRAAFACSVCFAEEAGGDSLRWAIGVLLLLVVVVQIVLARLLWRVLRAEATGSSRSTAYPAQVQYSSAPHGLELGDRRGSAEGGAR